MIANSAEGNALENNIRILQVDMLPNTMDVVPVAMYEIWQLLYLINYRFLQCLY